MPSGTRKPLPPEPSKDSGPPPPPLPSRPRQANGVPQGVEDYLQADDDWTDDDGAPALPPRNFSPSPEDGETYEVPDNPSPPITKRLPPPPSGDDFGGEVYDELEGIAEDKPKQKRELPPPLEGEIYDQCDIKEETAETGGEIYEEAEVNQVDDEEVGELYEAPDQNSFPKRQNAPLPPPPPSPKAPPQPPSTNTLPTAPLPSRTPGTTAQAKLQVIKKMSGEGPAQLGISLNMLGQKKAALRKVSNEKEPELSEDTEENSDDTASVKDKISKFKAAESGIKPVLKPKPLIPTSPKPTAAVSPTARPVSQTNTPDTRSKSPTSQAPSGQPTTRVTAAPPPQAYPEEIYDDAINVLPPKDPLDGEVWYHGEGDRSKCESDLTKNGQDGTYLVRKSIKGGDSQPYTLVVLYKNHVYNLRIRLRPDGKIALGNEKEAEQELAFDSVPELISHHTSNEVILINKNENKQYRAVLKNPLQVT